MTSAFQLVCVAVLASAAVIGPPAGGEERRGQMAVTVDDLPLVSSRSDPVWRLETTTKLLDAIRNAGVPAVGFVNENKLLSGDEIDPARVNLLERWLDAGLELGNHTYSHIDLHRASFEEFQQDVLRGEPLTRRLMHERKLTLRYFRHPYLHTGTDPETRRKLDAFLHEHGYRVAPVTIDNSEWIFSKAYDVALDGDEEELPGRIGAAYVVYMERKLAHFERQSRDLFGRPIRHVLLIHANRLNADYFGALAGMLRGRGYAFVTLDVALEDPAYGSQDTYTGRGGISWLHRWALTRGLGRPFFEGEPLSPDWILKLAGVDSE